MSGWVGPARSEVSLSAVAIETVSLGVAAELEVVGGGR